MLRIVRERLHQGYRTMRYPGGAAPELPQRFRGLPVIDPEKCVGDCAGCRAACPTGALALDADRRLSLDMGRCLFCGECEKACPEGAVVFTREHRMSARRRPDLLVGAEGFSRAEALASRLRRLLGRSLRLRQVSAGGCNACEADANVLSTVGWDMGRFGIQFVASPRHADGLLVTGPVTSHMRLALEKTWEAVPEPKILIASGSCAISGGPYAGAPEASDGVSAILPVDLFVPGCPPHPLTLLDGLLRLLGRIR
jgi:Ni,Fe-hydrogenase III small subunit/formate hydrogenlyase subunit 6/NADH:ubiquinone oxidoreductase subunit I